MSPFPLFLFWVVSLPVVSPWSNRTGWLGVKHQLTYLLTRCPCLLFQSSPLLSLTPLHRLPSPFPPAFPHSPSLQISPPPPNLIFLWFSSIPPQKQQQQNETTKQNKQQQQTNIKKKSNCPPSQLPPLSLPVCPYECLSPYAAGHVCLFHCPLPTFSTLSFFFFLSWLSPLSISPPTHLSLRSPLKPPTPSRALYLGSPPLPTVSVPPFPHLFLPPPPQAPSSRALYLGPLPFPCLCTPFPSPFSPPPPPAPLGSLPLSPPLHTVSVPPPLPFVLHPSLSPYCSLADQCCVFLGSRLSVLAGTTIHCLPTRGTDLYSRHGASQHLYVGLPGAGDSVRDGAMKLCEPERNKPAAGYPSPLWNASLSAILACTCTGKK